MSVILQPNGSSDICATYFPIPKALTEHSESATPMLLCPNNPFFISKEKTAEEGLLAKLPHISAFLSLQMRDTDLTLQVLQYNETLYTWLYKN